MAKSWEIRENHKLVAAPTLAQIQRDTSKFKINNPIRNHKIWRKSPVGHCSSPYTLSSTSALRLPPLCCTCASTEHDYCENKPKPRETLNMRALNENPIAPLPIRSWRPPIFEFSKSIIDLGDWELNMQQGIGNLIANMQKNSKWSNKAQRLTSSLRDSLSSSCMCAWSKESSL